MRTAPSILPERLFPLFSRVNSMPFEGKNLPMHVYMIQATLGGTPCIKIGVADWPLKRMRDLQIGSPVKLELLDSIRCKSRRHAFDVERYAHTMLGSKRQHGEWFHIPERWQETMELIRSGADKLVASFQYEGPKVMDTIEQKQPLSSATNSPVIHEDSQSRRFHRLPGLWTEPQVAEYFGVSEITVARERQRGRLRFTRVADCIRFTDEHIIEYLKTNEAKGVSPSLTTVRGDAG